MTHEPVLLGEALDALAIRGDGIYVDATVGGGGHGRAIAERLQQGRLVGLDLDPEALAASRAHLADVDDRVTLRRASYAELARVLDELGIERVDGVLFDLGLSSHQLADATRGFSFQSEGPLDMRFDPDNALTAADIVNRWDEAAIARILQDYGEERFAKRIARAIVEARRAQEISTSDRLVELILAAIPQPAQRGYHRGRDVHPATRTFQALRIAVNDELTNVELGLTTAFERLAADGRLAVITFHSLEDRLVKRFMKGKAQGCVCPPDLPVCACGREPEAEIIANQAPSAEEQRRNPRARSARLRALRKVTSASAQTAR